MYSIHVSLFSLIAYFACILSNRLSASEEFCPCLQHPTSDLSWDSAPSAHDYCRNPCPQYTGWDKKNGATDSWRNSVSS